MQKFNKIKILDTKYCNLISVYNFFKRMNYRVEIINQINDIKNTECLVIPGLGNFNVLNKFKTNVNSIKYLFKNNYPIMGICLGLQIFFEESEESKSKGMSLIKGKVKNLSKLNRKLITPHIGWEKLKFDNRIIDNKYNNFYFMHSFYCDTDQKYVQAWVEVNKSFYPAIVRKNNFFGLQFHPEKSGKNGEILVKKIFDNLFD